jgi:hypothetical protein
MLKILDLYIMERSSYNYMTHALMGIGSVLVLFELLKAHDLNLIIIV